MPTVGLDYRYPFISAHSWGTQIIEPRAQVIIRPNEQQIGRFPNEDSQALVFDDANLFAINKFPGYDRVEGGGRANVGVQYTAQFNQGGYFNAMFGQSYQLFGVNSYAVADMANAGLDSGLETRRSDYVARATYQPNKIYTFASRFRFDDATFETKRLELEGRVNFDRWTAALTYGRYDAQPINGLLLPREGVSPSASVRLTQNWSVSAAALYSIDSARLNTAQLGLSYIDECLALNLVFSSNYGYSGDIVPNRTVMLQLNLRTLGAVQTSQSLSNVTSISNTGQASWF
jgi:LPS-assembly protein